jgi:hypothetical protein
MIKFKKRLTAIFMCFIFGMILCNPISAIAADKGRLDIIRLKGSYTEIGMPGAKP